MKSIKTKLFASASVAVMALSVVIPSFVGIAQASVNTTKTVYIDVEKNALHGSPLLEPVAVTLSDTDTILDATEAVAQSAGLDIDATTGQYAYVKAFADTDTTATYAYTSDVSTATNGVVYRTDLPYQPIVSDSNWLRETEYNGISGWTFTVNNAVTYGGGTYYMASTALSALPDNAVIRWEFSEAFGADLGLDGAYVPTAVDTGTGLYDWTTAAYFAPRFTRANKTTLISKMADHTNKADAAYANALTALETLTNTQSAVDTAAAAL